MDDESLVNTISGAPAPAAAPNAVSGVARGSALNLVGSAVTAILSFVVVAVITRGVSKIDAGIVFTATSLFVVVESLARFGADGGVVHHLAGALAEGRQKAASNVLLASFLPVAIGSALVGLVIVALAVPLEGLVAGNGSHRLAIVVIIAVAMPFAATYDVMAGATRALGTQRPTVIVERLLRPSVQLIAVGLTVAIGGQPVAIVAAWILPYLLSFAVMGVWLRMLLGRSGVPLWSPEWRESLRPVWLFTGPRAAASFLQNALQRLDIVLVSAIVSLPAAAVYTGATRFVVVGQLGNQAVGYSLQPQLRRFLVRDQKREAFELFQASTIWIILVTWPLYLVVISFAPLLVKVFGPQYGAGERSAVIVTSAMLVAAACGVVDYALLTVGKSMWNLANVALGLVVNVVLDVVLLPRIGIEGAAIGWALAIVLTNVVPLWQIYRLSGLHPVSKPWAEVIVVALIGFLGLPELGRAVYSRDSIGPLAGLVAGSAGYLGFVFATRSRLRINELVTSRRSGGSRPSGTKVR